MIILQIRKALACKRLAPYLSGSRKNDRTDVESQAVIFSCLYHYCEKQSMWFETSQKLLHREVKAVIRPVQTSWCIPPFRPWACRGARIQENRLARRTQVPVRRKPPAFVAQRPAAKSGSFMITYFLTKNIKALRTQGLVVFIFSSSETRRNYAGML